MTIAQGDEPVTGLSISHDGGRLATTSDAVRVYALPVEPCWRSPAPGPPATLLPPSAPHSSASLPLPRPASPPPHLR